MSDELAYAARLISRLDAAQERNQQISSHNLTALERLDKALPVLSKRLKGDEAIMAVIREVYSVLEEGAEESQSTITEIKQARDSLETALNLLKQAGYDISNIQTFTKDKIWLGNHLPTIKQALEVFNTKPASEGEISLFDQALDSLDKERFEDIAHAVKRSGDKRQSASEAPGVVSEASPDAALRQAQDTAAVAAVAAVEAIKVATALIPDAPEGTASE